MPDLFHAFLAVGAEFGMNKEVGALKTGDTNYYGYGVGTTGEKLDGVNMTFTVGAKFILPDLMKFFE